MKHRQPRRSATPFSFRLPDDVKNWLAEESITRNVTISYLIVNILRWWRDLQEKERKRG